MLHLNQYSVNIFTQKDIIQKHNQYKLKGKLI